MADNYLITGYWGEPHVTAENDRGINAAMFGTGRFVLPVGEQFRAEYIGNNTVRLYDGKLMDNGAAAGIPAGTYVDLLIPEAGQGMKRNDLVVFQYSQDDSTLVESGIFTVIHGTETSGTASDPTLTQEDLLTDEATFDQMALYRVSVAGAEISAPVKLFSVYQRVADHAARKNNPHGVTCAQVGAAPAGWGIGNLEAHLCADDAAVDSLLIDEIASMGGQTFKRFVMSFNGTTNFTSGGGHYYVDVYKLSANYARIDAKSYVSRGRDFRRVWFYGALEPWEWVNPPMVSGVSYRTTERWNGKAVYAVLFNMGTIPKAGTTVLNLEKTLSVPADAKFVSVTGYVTTASTVEQIPNSLFDCLAYFPSAYGEVKALTVRVQATNVPANTEDGTATVVVKYTVD